MYFLSRRQAATKRLRMIFAKFASLFFRCLHPIIFLIVHCANGRVHQWLGMVERSNVCFELWRTQPRDAFVWKRGFDRCAELSFSLFFSSFLSFFFVVLFQLNCWDIRGWAAALLFRRYSSECFCFHLPSGADGRAMISQRMFC